MERIRVLTDNHPRNGSGTFINMEPHDLSQGFPKYVADQLTRLSFFGCGQGDGEGFGSPHIDTDEVIYDLLPEGADSWSDEGDERLSPMTNGLTAKEAQ